MLDARWQGTDSVKETLVGGFTADLVDLAFGSAIGKQDPLLRAKVAEQTVVAEGNVATVATDDDTLVGVRSLANTVDLVVDEKLEEEEEEVSSSTDMVEYGCAHEFVRVSTESVDEIVVVEHVDHRHLSDRLGERPATEPLAVVVEHVSVNAGRDFGGEGRSHSLLAVKLVPFLHLGLAYKLVAVDLITTANDSMVRLRGMSLEHVIPEWIGTVELGLVHTGTETVAAVTGPSEVLGLGRNEEGVAGQAFDGLGLGVGVRLAINRVVDCKLMVGQGDLDLETPEGERALNALVLVELDGLGLLVRVVFGDGGRAICSGSRDGGSVLPSELKGGCDRVVAGSILGNDHSVSMINR